MKEASRELDMSQITDNDMIQMARGTKHISDDIARAIEKKKKLPAGWMDRHNTRLTDKLSAHDFALVLKIMEADATVKAKVSKLLADS